MSHEEQYQRLCEILSSLVEIVEGDDLSLLAHHCGVKISDFYGCPEEVQTVEVIEWERKAA